MLLQEKEHAPLESLVVQSIALHQEMVDLLGSLPQTSAQSVDSLQQFNSVFSTVLKNSRHTDSLLTEQLQRIDAVRADLYRLLEERTLLQQRLLQLVKESAVRAGSIKSLLACEMQTVKAGRKALLGYKRASGKQGRIIDSRQ